MSFPGFLVRISRSGVALLLLVECAASQAPAGGCDVGPSLGWIGEVVEFCSARA